MSMADGRKVDDRRGVLALRTSIPARNAGEYEKLVIGKSSDYPIVASRPVVSRVATTQSRSPSQVRVRRRSRRPGGPASAPFGDHPSAGWPPGHRIRTSPPVLRPRGTRARGERRAGAIRSTSWVSAVMTTGAIAPKSSERRDRTRCSRRLPGTYDRRCARYRRLPR